MPTKTETALGQSPAEDHPSLTNQPGGTSLTPGHARIPDRGPILLEHGALTDTAAEVAYVRELTRAGWEILLTRADKKPDNIDMLKARGVRTAERTGFYLATSDPDLAEAYVRQHWANRDRETGAALSVGVRVGQGSGLVIVDADNDAEVGAWRAWWRANVGGDLPAATVSSPGVQDAAGAWVHKNGGHWYLQLPAGYLIPERAPAGVPVRGGDHQATLKVRDSYAVMPPSVRAEGPYRVTGEILPAPTAVLDLIDASASSVREPREFDRATSDHPIDAWAASVTWDELLTEAGWTPHDVPERCGCPTWTRPGGSADPKSAVAHGDACDRGNDQLHVWSNTVQNDWGTSNLTKAQFVAHTWHGGDLAEALNGLGIDRPAGGTAVSAADLATSAASRTRVPGSWERIDLTDIVRGKAKPVVPVRWRRDDGLHLLYPGLTHSIHGESESGKSLLMQAEAVATINSGGRVLFLDYESDQFSVVGRLREMGADDEAILDLFDYRRHEDRPDANPTAWDEILAGDYALIIIDGVTASLGTFDLSGMSNDDVNAWTRALPRKLAEASGAPLVMVDHVTKSDDGRGRWAIGAQAKMADITGAAYTVEVIDQPRRGHKGKLRVRVGKDRPGYVRPRCAAKGREHMQVVGEVVVDGTGPRLTLTMEAPATTLDADMPVTSKGTARDEDLMARIWAEIVRRRDEHAASNTGAEEFLFSQNEIESSVKGKSQRIRDHVKTLANEEYIEATGARFRLLRDHYVNPKAFSAEDLGPAGAA